MYQHPYYHAPGAGVVVWGGGVNNLCTVETEADINLKQVENCIKRGKSLRLGIERTLQEFRETGGNFDESPVHYIIDAVGIWLNDAFNIIRDYNLERLQSFPQQAIAKMKRIKEAMQFLEQKKKPGVQQKCTFDECLQVFHHIDDIDNYLNLRF